MRSRSSSNRGRRKVGSQKMEHQKNIHLHPPQKSGSINRGREGKVETKGNPKQHPKGSDMEKTGARKAGKEKKRSSKQPTAKNQRHGGQTVATT